MSNEGDLAVIQEVSHDGVRDWTGVNLALLQISQEEHVDVAFQLDGAVLKIDELEGFFQVSRLERNRLVFEISDSFDGLDELILLLRVVFNSFLLIGLDLGLPLETEFGSWNLEVKLLDLSLDDADFLHYTSNYLLQVPLIVICHSEAYLCKVLT